MTLNEICPYDQKGRFLCRYRECTTMCTWRYNVGGRGGKGREKEQGEDIIDPPPEICVLVRVGGMKLEIRA
jgi:hypothetical protein